MNDLSFDPKRGQKLIKPQENNEKELSAEINNIEKEKTRENQ